MIITIGELVRDINGTNLACVPMGGESFASLTSEERLTLWRFDGVALEVDAQALPLHVYLMGGSMKRLAIYPRSGCIKIPGTRCISLSDEENGHELVIHRAPKDYIYP